MTPRLLIIEDEAELAAGLKDSFEFEGYQVIVAADGEQGLEAAVHERPDLILLDVMLPKLSGLEVCKTLRRRGLTMPIIMLTARGDETDKVTGLELGADDYVTKPFSLRELTARVKAQLRRSQNPADIEVYRFGSIVLDFRHNQAQRAGQELELTPREFEILRHLIRHRGEIVTREQLLEAVWGITNYPLTRTVDNHIVKLRQKIEDSPAHPKYLVTVHRLGYKFVG
ncbi:MAG: response regulator transcription factor [Bryobacteraceae bacterium]|nr:response regulator transcription factor [Bryobacteraceae bacterium]MDW8377277.1 response regulator transcription factor [Bryobacterales bacterium]